MYRIPLKGYNISSPIVVKFNFLNEIDLEHEVHAWRKQYFHITPTHCVLLILFNHISFCTNSSLRYVPTTVGFRFMLHLKETHSSVPKRHWFQYVFKVAPNFTIAFRAIIWVRLLYTVRLRS